ncbi:MAG: tryptophan--tRNA ligase [Elusimicrobia bacterium]|nr:tryptophan--tRNA ligase [Elusimicrobiota bacterium]MDE2426193.1 tryptophan--tRNA ligase [Elusimicrobiota bacterium]
MSRVVSGMRPTGRLHLGNYFGALKNWIELSQRHGCRFFIADWHMLTTGYEETGALRENVRELVLELLAAGLDPARCLLFRQSDVPEHAELALLLGMVTPLSWLENNPTWKEQLQELSKTKLTRTLSGERSAAPAAGARHELRTFGHLGYPVLQAADILLYRGEKVPVGQDQLPHLELSREIARRFNSLYGQVFPEPQALLTQTPKLPGLDGRKMSKSYGNALDLSEAPEALAKKVMGAYTDPTKLRKDSPGHPEPCAENPPGCAVYALEKLYLGSDKLRSIAADCRAGKLGCVADKRDNLLPALEAEYARMRQQRERFSGVDVEALLAEGAEKARAEARATMREARRAMGLA